MRTGAVSLLLEWKVRSHPRVVKVVAVLLVAHGSPWVGLAQGQSRGGRTFAGEDSGAVEAVAIVAA